VTVKNEVKITELKRQARKVKREYEELGRKQDWALSEYLRTHDDSHLREVAREIERHAKKLTRSGGPKKRTRHPDRSEQNVRESALLSIQEDALTALATGQLTHEGLTAFVDDRISRLTVAEALDIYKGLATLDDEQANVALVERMFKATQRGKAGKRPVDVAGAALRLAKVLLTTHITSWACSIVDGTVPKPATRTTGIFKGSLSAPTVPKRRG
jgi:hypothetical protein